MIPGTRWEPWPDKGDDCFCVGCGKVITGMENLPGVQARVCEDIRCHIEDERLADDKLRVEDNIPSPCFGKRHQWGPAIVKSENLDGKLYNELREKCAVCQHYRCSRCGQPTISVWCGIQSEEVNVFCSACFHLGRAAEIT